MKNVINWPLLLLTSIFLCGCASGFLNEGATRVRVSQPGSDSASAFTALYFRPAAVKESTIDSGKHFSISLMSAYLCGFRESRGLSALTLDSSNPAGPADGVQTEGCTYGGLKPAKSKDRTTRGEISILVNAGESSANVANIINPSDGNSKGRVIYYDDDVRESGQLINAINLPIYGPKAYGGKNFVFDLWMLELDNEEAKQSKTLLSSLAGLGAKAYPPSAPILGVLNTLGGAFLSGNKDDLEARIQMRFDVKAPEDSKVVRIPLAEGYYAFVREENRDLNPEWGKFAVNEADGVLCRSTDGKTCVQGEQNTYRDRTWFLVRIAKETPEAALDIEYGEELGKFMEKMSTVKTSDINDTKEAINSLGESLRSVVCNKSNGDDKNKSINCSLK
jgi:hypothetical protein